MVSRNFDEDWVIRIHVGGMKNELCRYKIIQMMKEKWMECGMKNIGILTKLPCDAQIWIFNYIVDDLWVKLSFEVTRRLIFTNCRTPYLFIESWAVVSTQDIGDDFSY